MKALKLEELELGVVYECILSGRLVLIDSIIEKAGGLEVSGLTYNEVTGYFDAYYPINMQLKEIE